MRIAFRTDASLQIGSGHLMRCLTLADALREQGAECQFICRAHEGHMMSLIEQRGYPVRALPAPSDNFKPAAEPAHAGWLGCDWEEDAEQTRQAIGADVVDWLIVDHYHLDQRWEDKLRPCCHRLMVIDDIANRLHSCDLLLDQNYDDQLRYQKLVPAHCKYLLGPRYALLRPEYAAHREMADARRRPLRRAFVFFGGSDPTDLTGMAVKALTAPALVDLALDVVVGANYCHRYALTSAASARGNTTIYGPRPHLADLMAAADIGIGAGGVTNWERMTMGLPSIVIALADNQVPISEQLHGMGVIRCLGRVEDASEERIRNALIDEVGEMKYLARIAPAMSMCDGKGAERVLGAIRSFEYEQS